MTQEARIIAGVVGRVIAGVLVVCAVLLLAVWAIEKGVEGNEKAECLKWVEEAGIYQRYYITGWQADQCAHYGIKINAPIH